MFNKSYRVIELLIDEEKQAILESVSLVDRPAIDRDFMYFSKEKPKYYFSEEEQRIVVGPAMIPDMKIARKDDDGEIYYVYFSKDTIQKAAELFLKYDKASAQNTDHRDNFNKEVYLMESWIIEDEYDKAFTKYGFSKLPIGTWMCKMRIMDDKVWAEVKDGKYKGFSVQGDFIFGQEKYDKAFAAYKRKYKGVRNKWKKLYQGLTQEEKLELDQILFLVEMNETDVFETPEMAMERSKQLGLKGEIHSHFDEDLKILIYMPGASHEDYERAIEVNEVKDEYEWDINALPNYIEEKRKKADFVTVSPGESKDDYIGRCMSSLQGEFPSEDQRYAVCITEWEGKSQFNTYTQLEKRIISDFLRDVSNQYGVRYFASVEELEVGDSVSWSTGGQNPRGKIVEIVTDGSKKVPGADFEINGTPDNPGYLIRVYEENAEGNWTATDTLVGRKADSLLKNVDPL